VEVTMMLRHLLWKLSRQYRNWHIVQQMMQHG
jgi:hypothetical protein